MVFKTVSVLRTKYIVLIIGTLLFTLFSAIGVYSFIFFRKKTDASFSSMKSPSLENNFLKLHEPMLMLDIYPQFSDIQTILQQNFATNKVTGEMVTGNVLLRILLNDNLYSPLLNNAAKEDIVENIKNQFTFTASNVQLAFLLNLANGLVTEYSHLYRWSLAQFSKSDINTLFVYPYYYPVLSDLFPENIRTVGLHLYNEDILVDAQYKQFSLAQKFYAADKNQEQVILDIAHWIQKNFFHANEQYGWSLYGDILPGHEFALPKTIDDIYQERVVGCHEPTVLLEGMLHNLNIPAVRLSLYGHGVLYLPSLNKFIHGDHIAFKTYTPSDDILFTYEQFVDYASIEDEIASWKRSFEILNATPLPVSSIYLQRNQNELSIHGELNSTFKVSKCVPPTVYVWSPIVERLSEYQIYYALDTCTISSKSIRIKSLDELSQTQ